MAINVKEHYSTFYRLCCSLLLSCHSDNNPDIEQSGYIAVSHTNLNKNVSYFNVGYVIWCGCFHSLIN